MKKTNTIMQAYFGKWGGFFVPDPMTPALDELVAVAERIIQNGDFEDQIANLVKEYLPDETTLISTSSANKVFTVTSQARWYLAAGFGLLAKASGREIVSGVSSPEEAKIVAAIGKKLGIPVSLWLNVATGSDSDFVKVLEVNGAVINTSQCSELFNDPDMYAFQKYISNPAKYLWASVHNHVGPYPFPSLSSYFSSFAAKKVIPSAIEKFKGKVVNFAAPAFPGIAISGLIYAGNEVSLPLSSYEPKADAEKEECYLGTYTQVAMIGKKDFILGPDLVHAWETGKVTRLETVAPINLFEKGNPKEVFVVIEE
jgi:tryptophan synthase beta subunit